MSNVCIVIHNLFICKCTIKNYYSNHLQDGGEEDKLAPHLHYKISMYYQKLFQIQEDLFSTGTLPLPRTYDPNRRHLMAYQVNYSTHA